MNKGQVNARAGFYARASRYTLWVNEKGLSVHPLVLRQPHEDRPYTSVFTKDNKF
jgi:hypothetical protein